jgi:hypothetical protein
VNEPSTPHDALFKWTFSQVVHARAELRAILPAAVLERVDLETLELCPGAFVDKALSASYSDLLYQVQIAKKPGFLYVLFEHQSAGDELMPLRLLGYLVRILELEARSRRDAHNAVLPLPIVLPVVLHHSARGWARAARFGELFDRELLGEPEIARLVPAFEFVLDDLSHLSDEALRMRALDHVSTLTLWALRDARTPERLVATVRTWSKTMRDLLRAPSGIEAFHVIFRYIALVAQKPIAQEVLEVVLTKVPTTEKAMATLAEAWIAEGRELGLQQGREEGRREANTLAEAWIAEGREQGKAEGREQACRDLLQQLITVKFGVPSDAAKERLARASEPELIGWTTRVLTASSIDEIFA